MHVKALQAAEPCGPAGELRTLRPKATSSREAETEAVRGVYRTGFLSTIVSVRQRPPASTSRISNDECLPQGRHLVVSDTENPERWLIQPLSNGLASVEFWLF